MTIICENCKNKIEECPECGGRITSNVWISIIALLISLILLLSSIIRWQGSLVEYDHAMKLRRTYLKRPGIGTHRSNYQRNR